MKKKENEKKMEELYAAYETKGDTLFAIGSCGEEDALVVLTGEPEKLSDVICSLLHDGLKSEAPDDNVATAITLIEGIRKLIFSRCAEALTFVNMIAEFMDEAGNDNEEFNPTDEECLKCKDYVKCLKRSLAEIGVEIEVKKMPTHRNEGN